MHKIDNPKPMQELNAAHQAMWDAGEHWEDDDFMVLVLSKEDADSFVGEPALFGKCFYIRVTPKGPEQVVSWEELQSIKSITVGDVEAMELYPCQTRTVNVGNHRHLICLPHGYRIPFGFAIQGAVATSQEAHDG